LGHGNGVDDDGDGLVDGCCDGEENPLSTDNLMTGGTQAGTLLTPEQVARARAIARATPGARVLTPTGFVNGDVIADSALDSLGDAQDGAVDMVALDMSINSATQTLSVSHRLRRTIPDSGSYRFVAFLDLDDDASTGGEPASLGFDTEFRGVEWITQVEIVEVGPSDQDIVVTAWQYAAGGFEQRTPDPGIRSFIDRHGELETDAAVFDRVGIEMSLQEVGALGERVVLQAQAQVEGSEVRDLLPNGGGAAGDLVRLSAPRVVDCAATPSPVRPGAELTVAASGLALNAEATVRFEGEVVASMTSNDQGEARVSFFVPFDQAESVAEIDVRNPAGGDMATGTRCTVGVKGPALVTVDIKPGTSVNPINLRSQGVVSVAILGSNLLNVADIDVTTLAFGPSGATPAPKNRVQLEDVNDDGLADLITHYRTQDLGITPRQGEACVRGMTFGGIPFAGCDAILTIASSGLGFELVLLLLPLMWLCARRRWAH
jgi:hypothetical protein